jgi:NAD(P)-dependent dehydrogenase (short-subunit alcohol dehydrogenase family)
MTTPRQWACVTGAGSGIGRSITLDLVSRGLGVFAVGRRLEKLEETKNLSKSPSDVVVVQADISNEDGRTKVQQTIGDQHLRFLIQNAGIVGPLKRLKDTELSDFQEVMATNVEAPIFLAKRLLPALEANAKRSGEPSRILHISSGCAHNPTVSWMSYSVSKAAFLMAYRCLALELAPSILVGSCKPGIVDTEMQDTMRQATEDDFPKVAFFKKLKSEKEKLFDADKDSKPHLPNRERLDTPENVAHFCWFLLDNTSKEEYSSQDWDIRDEALAARWT